MYVADGGGDNSRDPETTVRSLEFDSFVRSFPSHAPNAERPIISIGRPSLYDQINLFFIFHKRISANFAN